MSTSFRTALLATAIGFCFAAPAVQAQDYYRQTAYEPESVVVEAPQYRIERNGLNAPSRISLRQEVAYDDLDLRTSDGADELRFRVSEAARDICSQLVGISPAPQLPGTHCYRDAVHAALVRADAAIRDARYYRGY
jgi:UrcA family protein